MRRIAFDFECIKGYDVLQCTYNDMNIDITALMLENHKTSTL